MAWPFVYIAVVGMVVSGLLPRHAAALSINVPPTPKGCALKGGDGELRIYSYPQKRYRKVQFERNGVIIPRGVAAASDLLASPDGGRRQIDIRVLRLADQIQDYLQADMVEVISGYRSAGYNQSLKAQGRGVARDSRHMYADALDLHIPEVTEEALRDYVQGLKCGGVGFYPNHHFVHIDFGPVRTWGEARGARKIVGEAPIVLRSEHNDYRKGDRVHFSSHPNNAKAWTLERFVRGTWHRVGPHTPKKSLWLLGGHFAFGRYRLAFAGPLYSNEFYLKRK
jgi:uncharacterized protein YcbK (DUF882 family)